MAAGALQMPSIKHTPEIVSHIIEARTADGPYGAKGVGEISSINTTPRLPTRCQRDWSPRLQPASGPGCAVAAMKAGKREVLRRWQDVK